LKQGLNKVVVSMLKWGCCFNLELTL